MVLGIPKYIVELVSLDHDAAVEVTSRRVIRAVVLQKETVIR